MMMIDDVWCFMIDDDENHDPQTIMRDNSKNTYGAAAAARTRILTKSPNT